MSIPTAVSITNLYLYGQENVPDNLDSEEWIRDVKDVSSIEVGIGEYMAGPGRFASPAMFDLVIAFFTFPMELAARTYSKIEMADFFGMTSYGLTIEQQQYEDGQDDYIDRSYVWGTTQFKIYDDACFIVDEEGNRRIEKFAVVPRGSENFDFVGEGVSTIFNIFFKSYVDPSKIGRTVEINFKGDVATYTLDLAGYLAARAIMPRPNLTNLLNAADLPWDFRTT